MDWVDRMNKAMKRMALLRVRRLAVYGNVFMMSFCHKASTSYLDCLR